MREGLGNPILLSKICNIHDSASLIVDCKSWMGFPRPSLNVVLDFISLLPQTTFCLQVQHIICYHYPEPVIVYCIGDAWILDLGCLQWTQLKHFPEDKPRLWHTASVVSSGEVIIHGGCSNNILDYQIQTVS